MVELVIKIHEKDYQSMLNGHIPFSILDAFKNGTPLPKGHGDLIDRDKLLSTLEKLEWIRTNCSVDEDNTNILEDIIDEVPTIIEADKENEK